MLNRDTIDPSTVLSTFHMDQLTKNHRHHSVEERLKISNIAKFESDRMKTNVPVKSKLQHPPGHLTVYRARGGGDLNVALAGWGI